MKSPAVCTALITAIDAWRDYQQAVAYSDRRGELTVEELLARQTYEAAFAQLEQATQTNQQEAA